MADVLKVGGKIIIAIVMIVAGGRILKNTL